MKNVLIVGVGIQDNFKDGHILSVASKLGHNIFVLAQSGTPPWFNTIMPTNNILLADLGNLSDTIAQIALFCTKNNLKLDAILTFKEHFVTHASVIAQAFGCIHTPIKTIFHSSVNKLLSRNAYNQIDDPDIIKSNVDVIDDLNNMPTFTSDKVIKPIFGSSSCGVKKISAGTSTDDLSEFLTESLDKKFAANNNRIFITEDYVAGKTYSVDGIVQNGQVKFAGINEYTYGPLPYFVQTGNIIPSTLNKDEQDFCYKKVTKMLEFLGFNDCPFHAEVIINNKKLYLIEIACRMPGGHIPRGYELAYGFNFIEQVIKLYMGQSVNFEQKTNFQIIQRGVHIFKNCNVLSIDVPQEAFNEIDFALITNAGEYNSYPTQNKPIYYYSVQENDFTAAKDKCVEIESAISIKFKKIER